MEGIEYIFQYPPFGPGWFVLRCDLGPYARPHTFTSHPFRAELALEHYNNCKTCKGHDSSKTYEPNDIVMNYGHRGRSQTHPPFLSLSLSLGITRAVIFLPG